MTKSDVFIAEQNGKHLNTCPSSIKHLVTLINIINKQRHRYHIYGRRNDTNLLLTDRAKFEYDNFL